MGTMAKMRGLAPAFILGAGVVFVLFMVISSSNVLTALGGGARNIVGSVNGEDITYQEFSQAVETQRDNQKQQTGKDIPEGQMTQFRNEVWNSMVNQRLIGQELKKYGITVYDQEIKDIILGDNPPEFLKRSFIDSTGKFNRQLYERAIYDPRNKDQLIKAEDAVRQMRMNEKLQSMLFASINVSDAEVKRDYINNTQKLKIKYALANINFLPDSLFKITDEDLKTYYNNNLDKYQVQPSRKVQYVLLKNQATHADSARIKDDLTSLKGDIQKGVTTFEEGAKEYSSIPTKVDTFNITQLPADKSDLFFDAKKGELLGPVLLPGRYALYKVDGIIHTQDTWVRASHILINKAGSDQKNYEEAMKIYEQLRKGANFAQLAKENSADHNSAVNGGDLGWYGKHSMVPEFEKATFNAAVGTLLKPFKTQYGYHIVKITGRTHDEFALSPIVEQTGPSPSTIDANYNAAADFSYIAKKDDFQKEAKLMNYSVVESPAFYKDSPSVPGILGSSQIVEYAFNNDLNSISDPYKVENGYVVVKITDVEGQRVKTFDEVKNQIRPFVLRDKKFEKASQIMNEVNSKINGNLDKAKDVNKIVVVDTTGLFPAGGPIPKLGDDYSVIDEAQKLSVGELSQPLKGTRGYLIIKLLYKTPFDSTQFNAQESVLRNRIYEQKKNTFLNEWISNLRKNADIVDNRNRFYSH
jgi:parvulin-like peptidyl-prolyl isomerase